MNSDPRLAKLPHVANCWRGGPDIYTVLSDEMSDAGFARNEYTIEDKPDQGKTHVLSGYVRVNDNKRWYVYLSGDKHALQN